MLIPTVLMGVLTVALLLIAYKRGGGEHIEGLKSGLTMLWQLTPMLVFALIVAGLIPELVSDAAMTKWLGPESGIKGVLVGSLAGGLAPGGPFVSLPVALGLVRSGASVGTMVAFLTGWSLWAISRMPLEFGILGWKLAVIRLVCVLIFPPLSGVIANLLFGGIKNIA